MTKQVMEDTEIRTYVELNKTINDINHHLTI